MSDFRSTSVGSMSTLGSRLGARSAHAAQAAANWDDQTRLVREHRRTVYERSQSIAAQKVQMAERATSRGEEACRRSLLREYESAESVPPAKTHWDPTGRSLHKAAIKTRAVEDAYNSHQQRLLNTAQYYSEKNKAREERRQRNMANVSQQTYRKWDHDRTVAAEKALAADTKEKARRAAIDERALEGERHRAEVRRMAVVHEEGKRIAAEQRLDMELQRSALVLASNRDMNAVRAEERRKRDAEAQQRVEAAHRSDDMRRTYWQTHFEETVAIGAQTSEFNRTARPII